MFNINNRPGQFFQQHKRRVMNRATDVGAALVVGDIVAIDMLGTATETAAGEGVGGITGLDVQDAIFHNIVEVAAGNLDGFIVVVSSLLSGKGADNTEVEVTLCGQRIRCRVDGGTVDLAIGDRLIPLAGTSRKLIVLDASVDGADVQAVAYALEVEASADAVDDVMFFGGMPKPAGGIAVA